MSSCHNCRALMVTLKGQISQLQQRQAQLLAVNNYLLNDIHQQSPTESPTSWKTQYQHLLNANQALQHQIKQLKATRIADQLASTTRIKEKNKMAEVMQTVVLEKTAQQRTHPRKRRPTAELVLRIVDNRL